jgi:hypothetical protein
VGVNGSLFVRTIINCRCLELRKIGPDRFPEGGDIFPRCSGQNVKAEFIRKLFLSVGSISITAAQLYTQFRYFYSNVVYRCDINMLKNYFFFVHAHNSQLIQRTYL